MKGAPAPDASPATGTRRRHSLLQVRSRPNRRRWFFFPLQRDPDLRKDGLGSPTRHAAGASGGVRHPLFFWLIWQHIRGGPVCMLVPPNWGWCHGGNTTHGATHSHPEYPGGVWSRTSARLGASTQRWPRSPEGGPPGTMYPSHPLRATAPLSKTARELQGICSPASSGLQAQWAARLGSCSFIQPRGNPG